MTQDDQTQDQEYVDAVHPVEARTWLGVSQATFNALVKSELLGRVTEEGYVFWEDLEHYNNHGTQWRTADRPDVPQRMMTADRLESGPRPPDIGPDDYPGVQKWLYILPASSEMPSIEEIMASDTGWLAHLCLTLNQYMWPAPASLGMVGPTLLKLRRKRTVLGARLRTTLYPDPWGSLALATVFQGNGSLEDSFKDAMDVAGPLLDELSVEYDQPLPVSHTVVVGIPSGLTITFFPELPKIRT